MHAWACHHHIAIAPCLQNALAMEMPLVLASATEEEACWGYEMNPTIPNELILGYTGIIGVHFKNNWGFISELGFKLGVIGLVTFNTGNLVLNQLIFKGVTGFFHALGAQL